MIEGHDGQGGPGGGGTGGSPCCMSKLTTFDFFAYGDLAAESWIRPVLFKK